MINNVLSIIFTEVLTPIAVPLFFIISGATMFRNFEIKAFASKLKSRFQTLVIPYLLWNVIGMAFAIITSYTFISSFFIGRKKFEITLINVLLAIFHHGCNGPFWFIFNLIVFTMIAPVIDYLFENRKLAITIICGFVILNQFGIGLPEALFYSRFSIIFYLIGCYIGKYHFFQFVEGDSSNYIKWVWGFVLFVVFYIFKGFLGFSLPPIISTIFLTAYALAFWNVINGLCQKRIIRKHDYMDNSFAVYALHVNTSAVITKLLYLVLPKNGWVASINFFGTVIITLTVIQIFCVILKKISPRIFALLMGKSYIRKLPDTITR